MSFEFKECPIKGLYEIQPKVFGDARGYFFECYSERDFFAAGLTEPVSNSTLTPKPSSIFAMLR